MKRHYAGWEIYYHGGHPVTGQYRAYKFGVRIGAGTESALISMIDRRSYDERERRDALMRQQS